MMKLYFVFSLIYGLCSCTQNFLLDIEPNDSTCLDEYFSLKTTVIYHLTAPQNFGVKLLDPDEQLVVGEVIFL
jgi:hypothetical protein